MDLGILIIRGVVGLALAAHGSQKLFGWFDGPGLRGYTRGDGPARLSPRAVSGHRWRRCRSSVVGFCWRSAY